jgi:hypothetical protein
MDYVEYLKEQILLGYKLTDLEKLINISKNTISGIVAGKRQLSGRDRLKIDVWSKIEGKPDPLKVEQYLFIRSEREKMSKALELHTYGIRTHVLGQIGSVDRELVFAEATDKSFDGKEINMVDYSEKAFAVVGDTKPIKEQLKALGGSFNAHLSCGAGWIFSKKKLDEVTKALSNEETETIKEVEEMPNISKYENIGVQIYDNLQDINAAVKKGKVISLCNLSQLVNTK